MEKNDEISKQAANLIEEAAEHTGRAEFPSAISEVEKAIDKLHGVNERVYRELHDIKGILEMLSRHGGNGYIAGNMRRWLNRIADEV